MTVSCSKCDNEAVYLRRHTAERLCRACLTTTTIDRVRRTINKRKMFHESDRIVVAISGGKDSAVLLDVLYKIERDFPTSEIVPLTIDEGIVGYRDKALDAAKSLTTDLDLDLEVYSFKNLFGMTLDEIVSSRDSDSFGACSYCGVFRRRAINLAAAELGADVVATGHNLDDEAQTVIMNIMRGDSRRLARTNRPRNRSVEGFIPRVKPIIELSERDIVAYSHNSELPYHDVPCPYATEAYRNDVRHFLNSIEHKRPGTMLAVLRSGETIAKALEETAESYVFKRCVSCGAPTSGRVCKVCSLLEELRG